MKDKYIYLGCAGIVCYMLPYLILGENAYITIPDFLDQNVVIMAMLKNTGLLTSISGIVPNMDGLERSLFPVFMPFDIKMLSYLLLPTYWAIVTYSFIYKLIAYLGMYLLIDTYVFCKERRWVTLILSLSFAFVPFYLELALSGAGFPLVLYAFANLYYNQNKGWSFAAIAFYAFNSLLAYGGFFFLVLLSCCIIIGFFQTKSISRNAVLGGLVLCLVYMVTNWGTLYALFFSDSFVSHRTEWVYSTSLMDDLLSYLKMLFFSQYHAGPVYAAPILVLSVIIVIRFGKKYPLLQKTILLYGLVAAGILVGILLKHTHIQLFVSIQFDRFYFFYPSVVFLLLASCCKVLFSERRDTIAISVAVLGLFCSLPCDYELKKNGELLIGRSIEHPTFKQFYDVELFSLIQKDMGIRPDYSTKTVSLGMFPAVPEYNGFYTLDSYRVNYPLEYKHKFRKIISGELSKNEEIRRYFDDWGSRCYLFSGELGLHFMFSKNENKTVKNLEIDTEALKGLGCEFILSTVDIKNYEMMGLSCINSYTTDNSYWNIRVYKLQ